MADETDWGGRVMPAKPIGPTDHLETIEYWRGLYVDAITVGQETLTKLKAALRDVSQDMHNTSTRPCGTCAAVTQALGEAFGCVAYQARLAKRAAKQGAGQSN